MTKLTIERTVAADIGALQNVLNETELFPAELLPDLLAPALAGDTDAFWYTCHLNGDAVGLCYTAPEELTNGTWNMVALAILPRHQVQGLGSALVQEAENHLRRRDGRLMIVETSGTDDFQSARSFYLRAGYAEEARIRDFWAEGDDKIIFRKELGS